MKVIMVNSNFYPLVFKKYMIQIFMKLLLIMILILTHYDFISSKGFVTDYSFLLKNFNTYSENSSVYEKKMITKFLVHFYLNQNCP